MAVPIRLDLTVAFHRIEAAREAVHFFGFDIECRSEGQHILWFSRGAQNAENFLPAGNLVWVLAQKVLQFIIINTRG
ncbi:hypothetical protein GCM10027343_00570 [Noviherbaspirillum agri]